MEQTILEKVKEEPQPCDGGWCDSISLRGPRKRIEIDNGGFAIVCRKCFDNEARFRDKFSRSPKLKAWDEYEDYEPK